MCKCCDKVNEDSTDKGVEQKPAPPPPAPVQTRSIETKKENDKSISEESEKKPQEPIWKEPQSPPEMICVSNAYESKYQGKDPELSDTDESSNRSSVLKKLPDTLESSVDESIDLRPIPQN